MNIKINKLYLKGLGKEKLASDEYTQFLIDDLKQKEIIKRAEKKLEELGVSKEEEITDEHRNQIDWKVISKFSEEEEKSFKEEAVEAGKSMTYKLLRVDKHFSNLNLFLFDNHLAIKEPNQLILLKNSEYIKLLQNNNLNLETETIIVWWDSNNKYCTIKPVIKEEILEALKQNIITTEKYEELEKLLD
jgi:hypothetical protein